jgi:hypothetical protein
MPDPASARSGDVAPTPQAASGALDLSDARTEPNARKQRARALGARHAVEPDLVASLADHADTRRADAVRAAGHTVDLSLNPWTGWPDDLAGL